MVLNDRIGWKAAWRINKFKDPGGVIAELLRGGAKISDIAKQFPEAFLGEERFEGNIALNEGLQLLIDIITGVDTSSNKWDSSNAHVGVGDGTTAEDASQTGLQGSNKAFVGMDTGYPSRTGQTVEFRGTFDGDTANFDWQEFTVVNGSDDSATCLNRKVADKGSKASGETWTLSLKITFS
ncbi:hypothetical protein J7L49_06870 [Candidatus Bathyarchaeota archaeon]|nr:hypothetical protein [Candidatus Bathyarchaeota archaeon]